MNNQNSKKSKFEKVALACLPYIIILLTIYLMIRYQILKNAVLLTSDSFLHFQRFYDTSMQIKTGNFSYFQTNFGFNHSGRIFNAMYGPFFAYLNGLVLLLVRNWFNFQILSIFVALLIAGIGMYKLALKAKVNQIVAILLALIYLQFGITVGILRLNFMAWGAALAPWAMMQVLYMVNDRERPIHWISLALIMSILGQVHLLSTVFIACTYIPFAIYGLVKTTNKKQMLLDLLKAIGLTLLLTANVWGAMLVSFTDGKISLPNSYILMKHTTKFSRFINIHGYLFISIILLVLCQVIYVARHFKKSVLNTFITIIAFLIIILSSKLMPWDRLQALYPVSGMYLQFPYRITVGAWPLMLLGVGMSATDLVKNHRQVTYPFIIFGLVLVLMQNLSNNYAINRFRTKEFLNPRKVLIIQSYSRVTKNRVKFQRILRTTNNGELFKYVTHVEPDYLPYIKHPSNVLYRKNILNKSKKYHFAVKGSSLIINWKNKTSKKAYLPVVMYKRSNLSFNGKSLKKIHKNTICQPLVKNRVGKNQAVLSFSTPTWFKCLLIITIIGWLGVLLLKLLSVKNAKIQKILQR